MSEATSLKVGFIGVGTMGRGMVSHLLKAGHAVTVYARNPDKPEVQEVLQAGAKLANSPREAATGADLTITMVPNSPQVREVILGEDGALAGAATGAVIADMSTINPATSRELAEICAAKGVHFLDAPVSGGSVGADTGTLTIMAGGERAAFDKALPAFNAMGKADAVYYIGGSGTGEVVKIINNMLGAISAAAASQAMLMGVKSGIDPQLIVEVVNKGSGANWQLANAFPRNVFTGAFKPGFFTELMDKDIGLSMELGEATGVAATLAETARLLYTAAIEAGYAKSDYTAIIRPLEQAHGVEVRVKPQPDKA